MQNLGLEFVLGLVHKKQTYGNNNPRKLPVMSLFYHVNVIFSDGWVIQWCQLLYDSHFCQHILSYCDIHITLKVSWLWCNLSFNCSFFRISDHPIEQVSIIFSLISLYWMHFTKPNTCMYRKGIEVWKSHKGHSSSGCTENENINKLEHSSLDWSNCYQVPSRCTKCERGVQCTCRLTPSNAWKRINIDSMGVC